MAQVELASASGSYNTLAELFPEGWGAEGETPEGTVWQNASEGLWLPLVITDPNEPGYTGEGPFGNFPVKPHGIFYADTKSGVVDKTQDSECGEAHSSPEVDTCRVQVAQRFATDASHYTSGGAPGVRVVDG